jgi:hypothetical protein
VRLISAYRQQKSRKFAHMLEIHGSSELSMVRSCSVGSPSVGCEHNPQPVMIEVFEAVGQTTNLFDDQIDCFGAAVGDP